MITFSNRTHAILSLLFVMAENDFSRLIGPLQRPAWTAFVPNVFLANISCSRSTRHVLRSECAVHEQSQLLLQCRQCFKLFKLLRLCCQLLRQCCHLFAHELKLPFRRVRCVVRELFVHVLAQPEHYRKPRGQQPHQRRSDSEQHLLVDDYPEDLKLQCSVCGVSQKHQRGLNGPIVSQRCSQLCFPRTHSRRGLALGSASAESRSAE